MLFNLLLANITILLSSFSCFLLFLIFFTSPVDNANIRLRLASLALALAIPTGVPITAANDAIEMLPLAADKKIKDLSKLSKEEIYLLSHCL